MTGCKKYREEKFCHCGLYGNATDEVKIKIIKAAIEKDGYCPCYMFQNEDTKCLGIENHELYSEAIK